MSVQDRDVAPTRRRPSPIVQPESEFYWAKLREHSLWLKQCEDCRLVFFYPRNFCPSCASRRTSWIPSKGVGTLYSYAIVHRAPAPAFDEVPYVVAIVELDEGARMPTSLVEVPCDPASIKIGMRVTAVFEDISPTQTLVFFRPQIENAESPKQ